jgi:hypothetical protein
VRGEKPRTAQNPSISIANSDVSALGSGQFQREILVSLPFTTRKAARGTGAGGWVRCRCVARAVEACKSKLEPS